MRKAQISGQMIVYIFGMFITALVIVYGYSAIKDFVKKSDDVALIQFEKELTNTIYTMSSDYGSVKIKTLSVPSGIEEVCFVDLDRDTVDVPGHPLVYDSWLAQDKVNIFLIEGVAKEFIFAGDIDKDVSYVEVEGGGHLCIGTPSGKLKVRIEGMGNKALISLPESTTTTTVT